MSAMYIDIAHNDDNGNPSGYAEAIDFGDWLRVEGRMRFRRIGDHHIRLGRRIFPILGFAMWVGNICWDAILVEDEVAQRIANYLRDSKRWQPIEGEVSVWDAWDKGEPIVFEEQSEEI